MRERSARVGEMQDIQFLQAYQYYHYQCANLSFYFVHSHGALTIKLHPEISPCTLPISIMNG